MVPSARVAVIVVNHQDYTRRYLAECYASLQAQTYPADRFTVFIVNNGLPEAEVRLTGRLASGARILSNDRNLGWGGGNNTAISVAMREGFDRFVLLNIDVIVDARWLAALVEAAEARADVDILQSKILLYGTSRINSFGNRIHFLGYGYCYGYGAESAVPPPRVALDYASGAAMLVKRRVFEAIGLFREEYFMYYDDVEFCWRARLAGFNVDMAEGSVCYHKYTFGNAIRWLYYVDRNRLMTVLTMERLGTLALILPCLVIAETVMTVYCVVRGWGSSRLKLFGYFLRPQTWHSIHRRRREIRALRRRRDAELVKRFSGQIVFAEIDSPVLRYMVNPLLRIYWAIVRVLIIW